MVTNSISLYLHVEATVLINNNNRSYLIKGVLPKYEAPIAGVSKINNKLSSDVTVHWKHNKKNFLADNIRKTKENVGTN